MPGAVMPKTSSGYLQKTNVGFVREKISCFLNLPLDKSHFITETGVKSVTCWGMVALCVNFICR